ncbi:MAG TPA: radical SAM protein [Dissulfurispiraceae bacterium]|nr:radical SAM protein [Dissulfurispiraceae bacterium]
MSPDTADHVIEFIEKNLSKDRKLLNVTFYGGEPLLSAGLVASMAERLKCIAARKGIEFMFQFVTNGTLLTPAIVEKLKPLGLKEASITLDGPEAIPNLSRPFRSGGDSFQQIVANLKAVCGMIDVNIGGNFTEANYREIPKLLGYLMDEGITPEKILA